MKTTFALIPVLALTLLPGCGSKTNTGTDAPKGGADAKGENMEATFAAAKTAKKVVGGFVTTSMVLAEDLNSARNLREMGAYFSDSRKAHEALAAGIEAISLDKCDRELRDALRTVPPKARSLAAIEQRAADACKKNSEPLLMKAMEECQGAAQALQEAIQTVATAAGNVDEIRHKAALELANKGKDIATAIFQENMEREDYGETCWPGDAYDIRDNSGSVVKAVRRDTYTTSSDYFDDLIQYSVVSSLQLGSFAGGGVPQPKGGQKLAALPLYNAWNCIAVTEGTVLGDAPFLFSRNLKLMDADIQAALQGNRTASSDIRWADKLDPKAKPFGNDWVIVVTRSGAVQIIDAEDLTPAEFFGEARFSKPSGVQALPAH